MTQQGPIADLSYRNYAGPKTVNGIRWWPIARNGIRIAVRKKFFWVLAALSAMPWAFLILQLIFFANSPLPRNRDIGAFPSFQEIFASSYGNWFWLFFVALLVGTGSIAADNRANALQVYLSKPITKLDYLIGKFMSIFLLVFLVAFFPMFMAAAYAALNEGLITFLKNNPTFFPKLLLLAAIPAAVHASILCGLSAWNKTPWVVGVIYTGVVFFWNNVALILTEILSDELGSRFSPIAEQTMRNFSIPYAISGIGFNLIGAMPPEAAFFQKEIVFPAWEPLLGLLIALSGVGLLLTFTRIRAVEVIKG